MSDFPPECQTEAREADQSFPSNEVLFRRLKPDGFDGVHVIREAIDMPNMSVHRSKTGGKATDLIWAEKFAHWGVFRFRVIDIPSPKFEEGMRYDFRPEHSPTRNCYHHSEIIVIDQNGSRVSKENFLQLPLTWQLAWKERLRRKCTLAITPKKDSWLKERPLTERDANDADQLDRSSS